VRQSFFIAAFVALVLPARELLRNGAVVRTKTRQEVIPRDLQ
jgi:hypothetical protein